MKALSEWLLSRRYRAVFGVVMASILFQGSSGALLALVTLARGYREALLVAAMALLPIGAAFVVLGAQPLGVVLAFGSAWLPLILLAALLNHRGSLNLCVQTAVLVTALVVSVVVLKIGDPVPVWRDLFEGQVIPWMAANGFPVQVTDEALDALALQMTGFTAAIGMLVTLGHLFLARWMQSLVEQPGGFGGDYRELRMGLIVGVLAGVIFTLNTVTTIAVIQNVAWVFIAAFFLQGLAVLHSIVVKLGASRAWLLALYVFLLVQFPVASVMLAGLGFVDNWTNIRARVRKT